MKYTYTTFAVLAALTLSAAGCSNTNLTKGQQGVIGGAASGAVIGQAIGRNTEATLIGAAVGTMLGYIVGNEMDKYDRMQLNSAYESGPSGQPVAWVNPDTGSSYQVVPQPAYQNSSSNQVCRQAEIMATIDGQPQKTITTACRNEQGQWVLQH